MTRAAVATTALPSEATSHAMAAACFSGFVIATEVALNRLVY